MDYDKDKVDDMVLALLWLTTFGEKQLGQSVLRAWKGHDWDALNRLHEKGFIGDPVGKANRYSGLEMLKGQIECTNNGL